MEAPVMVAGRQIGKMNGMALRMASQLPRGPLNPAMGAPQGHVSGGKVADELEESQKQKHRYGKAIIEQ